LCSRSSPYSLDYHRGGVTVFGKLCKTEQSLSAEQWATQGSDQQNFCVHVSSFWGTVLLDQHVLWMLESLA